MRAENFNSLIQRDVVIFNLDNKLNVKLQKCQCETYNFLKL